MGHVLACCTCRAGCSWCRRLAFFYVLLDTTVMLQMLNCNDCRLQLGEAGMQALVSLGAGDMRRTLNIFQVPPSAAFIRSLKWRFCFRPVVGVAYALPCLP